MFSFYKNRFKFLALSGLFILAGIITIFVKGLNLDIQFKGGSILAYSYKGEVDTQAVEEVFEGILKDVPVTVQTTKDLSGEKQNLLVSISGQKAISTDTQTEIRQKLTEKFPNAGIEVGDIQVVDPYIGGEMLRNAIIAILIASVLIVAYVGIRFKSISGLSAGVFALLALLHDVLIAFFAFVFLNFPLNENVVAVILSILGWSVNDTIVIYDRIRENMGKRRAGEDLPQLIDRSVNESLSRTLNTSAAAFVAVMITYVFALIFNIESISEFALPMAIGLLAGSYSTIFLCTPFWTDWKLRKGRSGFES